MSRRTPGPGPNAGHGQGPSRRRFLSGTGAVLAATAMGPGLVRPAAAGAASRVFTEAAHAAALRALGRTSLRRPGSLPFPGLRAGTDTLPGIEHIVVLMLENRSFDHMLGYLYADTGTCHPRVTRSRG
jgi:phospholipase C